MNEIKKLDHSKATQKSDIPTKIIKENVDILTDFFLWFSEGKRTNLMKNLENSGL